MSWSDLEVFAPHTKSVFEALSKQSESPCRGLRERLCRKTRFLERVFRHLPNKVGLVGDVPVHFDEIYLICRKN